MIKKQEQINLKTRPQDVQNKCDFFIYYVDICKYEHENNMTMLWCKIVLKTNVEHIKGNEGTYFYLYFFGDLTQGNF